MPRRKVQHACGVAWRARSSTDDAPLRQNDVKGRNLQVALRYADEAQRALRPKGAEMVSPGHVSRHGDENEVKGACSPAWSSSSARYLAPSDYNDGGSVRTLLVE